MRQSTWAKLLSAANVGSAAPQLRREACRLIMLQIVEAGVGAGEAQQLVEEKMQVGRQLGEQGDLSLLGADLELALFFRRCLVHRRLQDKPQVIQHNPRGIAPRCGIGVEVHLAMAVVAQEPPEARVEWAARQVYIALGFLLAAAAGADIDACPMEGFDNNQFDEILGLKEKNLHSVVLLTVGYRSPEDNYQNMPKVRLPKDELFVNI